MTMREQAMRLSDTQRNVIRVSGILATLAALVFIVLAFAQFFGGMPSSGGSDGFDQAREVGSRLFIFFAIGAVLLFVGTTLLRLGFLRPISQIVATETEGAFETVGGAVGKGWRSSKEAGSPDVRLRCRSCGNLEKDTARFCSSCGEEL